MVGSDELNVKGDPNFHEYESPDEVKESSFSNKPFALPRPSLVRPNYLLDQTSRVSKLFINPRVIKVFRAPTACPSCHQIFTVRLINNWSHTAVQPLECQICEGGSRTIKR